MRISLIFSMCLALAGCAVPSETLTVRMYNKDGGLVKKVDWSAYDNSVFHSGRQLGLKIGYDPSDHVPVVKCIYGRFDSGRLAAGTYFDMDYTLSDVNLLTGNGDVEHIIHIGPGGIKLDRKKRKKSR